MVERMFIDMGVGEYATDFRRSLGRFMAASNVLERPTVRARIEAAFCAGFVSGLLTEIIKRGKK